MDASRIALVIGAEAVEQLKQARIAVIGLGGVGSYVAEALARSGVGHLLLIDGDTVASSNLNRQLVALSSTLERPKALVMAERIADINSECQVEVRTEFYQVGEYASFFGAGYDYIIDAIDDVPAKLDILTTACQQNQPIVSSMGTGNKLDPSKLQLADISKTTVCPLARSVRTRLRKQGITKGVTVVFSTEEPRRAEEATVPGSMTFVPASAGLLLASYVVRQLLKLN